MYEASPSNESSIYSPTLLSARLNNTNSDDQRVLFIFEVLDSSGKVAKLDFQEYSIRLQSVFEFSPIWIPQKAGNYTVRYLAINNLGQQIFNYKYSTEGVNVKAIDDSICSPRLNTSLTLDYWLKDNENKFGLFDKLDSRFAVAGFANATLVESNYSSPRPVVVISSIKNITAVRDDINQTEPALIMQLLSINNTAIGSENVNAKERFQPELGLIVPISRGMNNGTILFDDISFLINEIVGTFVRTGCDSNNPTVTSASSSIVSENTRMAYGRDTLADGIIFAGGPIIYGQDDPDNPCDAPPGCYPPPRDNIYCEAPGLSREGCIPRGGNGDGQPPNAGCEENFKGMCGLPREPRPLEIEDSVWDQIWECANFGRSNFTPDDC